MTLSTRVWRQQPVCRYRFLSAQVSVGPHLVPAFKQRDIKPRIYAYMTRRKLPFALSHPPG